MTEIKPPVVTADDVLKGVKEVAVLARDGTLKKVVVSAMNWRTALGASFKSIDAAMIHLLENCIAREAQPVLDSIIPLHLVWLTNVAHQLTNGIDALKKASAPLDLIKKEVAPAPAATPEKAPDSATSSPSNVS